MSHLKGGTRPEIDGAHYAFPCTCGHRTCRKWQVSGFADYQGDGGTQEESELVANVLNFAKDEARRELLMLFMRCAQPAKPQKPKHADHCECGECWQQMEGRS